MNPYSDLPAVRKLARENALAKALRYADRAEAECMLPYRCVMRDGERCRIPSRFEEEIALRYPDHIWLPCCTCRLSLPHPPGCSCVAQSKRPNGC